MDPTPKGALRWKVMNTPPQPRPAQTLLEAEDALLSRWPETRLEPTLDRIAALMDILGDPQRAYPVIQLTGTNGKTSTARMFETLLRSVGLRTGRFTSPHLVSIRERIALDGEPLSEEQFVFAFNDVAPYTHLVDATQPHPLSFFETLVAMAYAAFADAPVDAAVVEVGMGGGWDATNVAEAAIAILTPIGIDHTQYLGDTLTAIATEKVGIIKAGSMVVSAQQPPEVAEIIEERCAEVGAQLFIEGRDYWLQSRQSAVGGQLVHVRGIRGNYENLFLPLFGPHQAHNLALALAAAEAFFTDTEYLSEEVVEDAIAAMSSPGRLEIVRRSPLIIVDVAHNPHGVQSLITGLEDAFALDPLIGVLGVMTDKDYLGMLELLEPVLSHLVCTANTSPRCLSATELAAAAEPIFGAGRISVARTLVDAIDEATTLAEAGTAVGQSISPGGVVVTGSVITVGEARHLLGADRKLGGLR